MTTIEDLIRTADINFMGNCRGNNRLRNNVWGRFAVYEAMFKLGYMKKVIAIEFNVHHSTVIWGLKKHNILYNSDKEYTEMFNKFKDLTGHNITPKEKLISLINNLPNDIDIIDSITNFIIKKYLN